jgi:anaerobic selenocysteine-containing dehydrogenase
MLTACTKDCPDSCSIIIKNRSSKPKVLGNPDHPITKGFTCSKIKKHINTLKSPNRITSPMLKSGSSFKKISWDKAFEMCAEKFNAILKNDPKKLLHIQGDGARGVTKAVTDKFFTSLGCSKTSGSLCDISGIQACIDDFGALDHNPIDDLFNSSHIVNFGKDFSSSSIHLSRMIIEARKKNIRVTSIWPGGGDYDKYADKLIKINPGTDRFLTMAITKCLIVNNDIDQSSLKKCTGRHKYFDIVKKYSFNFLSEQCGVSLKDIKNLASIYAKNKVSTFIGWGVQRYLTGMETVRHINALSWLSGNVGHTGAGVYFSVSSLRNLHLDWIDHKPERSLLIPVLAKEIEQCNPAIEAAFVNCSNVVNQAPDSRQVFETLKNINFTVVADAFMNDTAAAADLILPCTLMWEEDEVLGSMMHDYLQYAGKVFAPPGECKSDFEIVKELSFRLNTDFVLPEREECFKLSYPESATKTSFNTFKKTGFVFAGSNKLAFINGTAHKKGLFSLVTTLTKESEKDTRFPLRLLSLINKEFIHSQITPEDHTSRPVMWINPDTEHIKKIDLNKITYLVSPIGRLQVKIKFDKSLHPDVIIYRKGYWMMYKGGINALIEARLTDSGTGAAYYAQHTRLEN